MPKPWSVTRAPGAPPIFPRILLPIYSVDNGVVCADGSETAVDAVIWCTRFKPALGHLASLRMITEEVRVAVEGARAVNEHRLWLVGYGEWAGSVSAILVGVTRRARSTVAEIEQLLVKAEVRELPPDGRWSAWLLCGVAVPGQGD